VYSELEYTCPLHKMAGLRAIHTRILPDVLCLAFGVWRQNGGVYNSRVGTFYRLRNSYTVYFKFVRKVSDGAI